MAPHAEQRLDTAVREVLDESAGDPGHALAGIQAVTDSHFAAGFARADEYIATVEAWVAAALGARADAPPICLPGHTTPDEVLFLMQRQEAHFRSAGFGAGLTDRANGGIPDLDQAEEYLGLFAEWNKKMQVLDGRVRDAIADLRRTGGVRLDERLNELRRWLGSEFKEATPEWKYPRTPLVDIGDQLTYELKVHVDNVRLSHFTRVAQVESQIRLDVLHLLRDQRPVVMFDGGASAS